MARCDQEKMSTPLTDPHPDAECIQIELLRRASAWRKLDMVGQINATVRTLALSGLQKRHPDGSPEMPRRMLADLILGEELAGRVYGESSKASDFYLYGLYRK